MLRSFLCPRLRDHSRDLIYQQNRASPHYAHTVSRYLDQNLGTRWIGKNGLTAWPPRSLDISRCDFVLWGYIKERVLSNLATSIEEHKAEIQEAVFSISEDTLKEVVKNIEFCWRILLRKNRGQFGNLLHSKKSFSGSLHWAIFVLSLLTNRKFGAFQIVLFWNTLYNVWVRADSKAPFIISLCPLDDQLKQLRDCTTAKQT